ncbi:MAG: hydantoinase/oxoprolinase family protein [Alphaproteobacteria bacterium]|nr:hydantoinase/oxoprolinase family protein [Alphaproteobacteria bacterium]
MSTHASRGFCRIGIDVGGTFTDFVLHNRRTGAITRYKEPSVPEDPSRSVELGLPALVAKAGVGHADVELIVHGTTLGLNTIIQRKGARLGLVVSKGNRGVLEIGRAQLANAFSFALQKEEPLVPRDLVLETSARLAHDGTVVARPTEDELRAIAATFAAAKVDAVTIMLLHSYARPELEREVAGLLRRHLPGVPITESAQIWPERREYERCLVALINAYVQPLMESYLDRLTARVRALGIEGPIYITANNGGTLSIETARQRPIDTLLSGPASGVVAASITAQATGRTHLITVDMGGTSADMSVIQSGQPEHTTRTHVGEFPLIVPVVSVSAIGAGGGSIVWVDKQGVLKVGPQSAGASPGPVCYGKGGSEPTVTDCYLLAGYIDPAHFLGGRMKLDAAAARQALEGIADRLGIAGADRAVRAAEAALRVTTAVMGTEIAKNIVQRGEDIRDYALVPFGGAGPTQANMIAEEGGIASILVPAAPSTFCALGAILADVKRDYVRSQMLYLRDGGPALDALARTFAELRRDAAAWIKAEGEILGATQFEAIADMRYAGQAYDLPVPIAEALALAPTVEALTELFHQAHEKAFGFRDLDSPAEVTTARLRVTGKVPPIEIPPLAAATAEARPIGRRQVFWDGGYRDATVYLRRDLPVGFAVSGPAVIEQDDTTTWIIPGWRGRVDAAGNMTIAREVSGSAAD